MNQIKQLFPSLVYQGPLSSKLRPHFFKELRAELNAICEIDDVGRAWSEKNYPGGYTSYSSINELQRFSTTFMDLEKQINLHVHKFSKGLELDLGGGKLKMTHFWVNIMPPNVTHSMHIHPLSVISGTFYVSVPKGSSCLKFEDPRLCNFMASPPRLPKAKIMNQRFISLVPKVGDLILFESWMRHEVPPNSSDAERISLSFNYEWV